MRNRVASLVVAILALDSPRWAPALFLQRQDADVVLPHFNVRSRGSCDAEPRRDPIGVANGGRVAILMRKGASSYELLVDDVTGEVVASYLQRSSQDAWHAPRLAADGSAPVPVACKVGAIDGQEIVGVGGSEEVFVPCSYASTQPYRCIPIPNSGAVLSMTPEQEQIVLLKP